jgi:hypothetical protein
MKRHDPVHLCPPNSTSTLLQKSSAAFHDGMVRCRIVQQQLLQQTMQQLIRSGVHCGSFAVKAPNFTSVVFSGPRAFAEETGRTIQPYGGFLWLPTLIIATVSKVNGHVLTRPKVPMLRPVQIVRHRPRHRPFVVEQPEQMTLPRHQTSPSRQSTNQPNPDFLVHGENTGVKSRVKPIKCLLATIFFLKPRESIH